MAVLLTSGGAAPIEKITITVTGGNSTYGYVTIDGVKYIEGAVEVEAGTPVDIYVDANNQSIKSQAMVKAGSDTMAAVFGLRNKEFRKGYGTYRYETVLYPVSVTIKFTKQTMSAYYSMTATITETEGV